MDCCFLEATSKLKFIHISGTCYSLLKQIKLLRIIINYLTEVKTSCHTKSITSKFLNINPLVYSGENYVI